MARMLSRQHDVTLFAPELERPSEPGFLFERYQEGTFRGAADTFDVIVVHGHVSNQLIDEAAEVSMVMDLYDPFLIENMHYAPELGSGVYAGDHATIDRQLRRGDFFLCATPEQRLFYLGMLTALGRIHPENFLPDRALDRLLAIVPCGIPSEAPRGREPRFRGKLPGIEKDDFLLFYGGVYDWQDPLTALEALDVLTEEGEFPGGRDPRSVKLLFVENPNRGTPQKQMERARAWCAQKGWEGDRVHFLDWLPYDERGSAYLECDAGVATFTRGLEVELSFRTRVLDWLWAGLPVAVTAGGWTAELLKREHAGVVVADRDPDALASAIRELARDPDYGRRGQVLSRRFEWETLLEPLATFCRAPNRARRTAVSTAPTPLAAAPASRETLSVTVVVPNYNGVEFLEHCLPSLLDLDFPSEQLEILVVDNASSDLSRQFVASLAPRVTLVSNSSNLGFSAAINQGAQQAKGELLAFLNNDTRVETGWLRSLVSTLTGGGSNVDAVAGKLLNWDGSKLDFGRGILMFDGHALQKDQGLEAEVEPYRMVEETFIACGGNMLIRKSVFLEMGGFDEDFFAYFEDVDLSWRLWSGGRQVLFDPGAVAYHHGSGTSNRMDANDRGFLIERNAFMALVKNVDDELFPRTFAAALLTMLHRNAKLVAANADHEHILSRYPFTRNGYRRDVEGPAPSPSLTIDHAQSIAHLRAVHYILENLATIFEKRKAIQNRRVVSDRDIFARFPPYLVPIYLGDRELFATSFFRWLIPMKLTTAEPEEISFANSSA